MQPVKAVPESDAAADHDRYQHNMQVVDQVCLQELVNRGGPAAKPYVEVSGCLLRLIQDLGRSAADEVEGCVAKRERFPLVMRHHEARRVERWILAPPALPAVLRPRARSGPELVAAHDLGTHRRSPSRRDRLVQPKMPVGFQSAPEPDLD